MTKTRKSVTARSMALALLACSAFAQTFETSEYRSQLRSLVEGLNASGSVNIKALVKRDQSGGVAEGSGIAWTLAFNFNGPVTIRSAILNRDGTAVRTLWDASGPFELARPAGTFNGGVANVIPADLVRDLTSNASRFTVVVSTEANPSGAIQGQLREVEEVALMGILRAGPNQPAAGVFRAAGSRMKETPLSLNSYRFDIQASYKLPGETTTNSVRMLTDPAGPGRFIGFGGMFRTAPDGSGSFQGSTGLGTGIPIGEFVDRMFDNPDVYRGEIVTTAQSAAALTTSMQRAGSMIFHPVLRGAIGTGPAGVSYHTLQLGALRNRDGMMTGAALVFDGVYEYGGPVEISSIDLAPATPGGGAVDLFRQPAPVRFGGVRTFTSVTSSPADLALLNALARDPEKYAINLRSTNQPDGFARGPISASQSQPAALSAVLSSAGDPSLNLAQGGLITLLGKNLVKTAADATGVEGHAAPKELNGTKVSIGGKPATILIANLDSVVAQVPFDAAEGTQAVALSSANGDASPMNARVVPVAPGLFSDQAGGLVLKNSDYSLVRLDNPASGGEVLLIYSVGLGQTEPPLESGSAGRVEANTGPVEVTIGGKSAEVLYSIAAPGFVGLYQTAVRLPEGLAPGIVTLTVRRNGVNSNPVRMAVR
jgi:uncharacterized protein (TIGR03437 family)